MTAPLAVRIMVQDVWDQVTLDLPASTSVSDAKRRALALTHAPGDPAVYAVKFRGAAVLDEGNSLADLGVEPNSSLIVLHRRRQPVR
jgi:hypothetical protein